MKVVSFSLEEGNKYFGRIDGKRFYIGSRAPYLDGKGLANSSGTAKQNMIAGSTATNTASGLISFTRPLWRKARCFTR